MVLELPLFQPWLHHNHKVTQPNSTCVHFTLYLQAGIFFPKFCFFKSAAISDDLGSA